MKKNFAKIFLVFLFICVSTVLRAETNQNEHVAIDSRPLSSEQRKLMEQRRFEEQQFLIENDPEIANEENHLNDTEEQYANEKIFPLQETCHVITGTKIPIRTSTLIRNDTAAPIYSPYIYHTIHSFPQETIIKLEDGSEWIFDPKDSYIVRSWRSKSRESRDPANPGAGFSQPDTVVISPKTYGVTDWFSGSNYRYVLHNKDLGNSVDVNPYDGPISGGEFTTWVNGLDFNLGQIYLINGNKERSVWEVSSTDFYLFKDWNVNDTIIVGENSGWLWWLSSYNHILINVNMNHHIRARQISLNHFPKPVGN